MTVSPTAPVLKTGSDPDAADIPPWKRELLLRKSALARTVEPNLSFICQKLQQKFEASDAEPFLGEVTPARSRSRPPKVTSPWAAALKPRSNSVSEGRQFRSSLLDGATNNGENSPGDSRVSNRHLARFSSISGGINRAGDIPRREPLSTAGPAVHATPPPPPPRRPVSPLKNRYHSPTVRRTVPALPDRDSVTNPRAERASAFSSPSSLPTSSSTSDSSPPPPLPPRRSASNDHSTPPALQTGRERASLIEKRSDLAGERVADERRLNRSRDEEEEKKKGKGEEEDRRRFFQPLTV